MPITSSSSKNNGGNSSGGNSRKPGSGGPMHVYAPQPVNINRHSYNVRRDTHPQTPPGTLYDPFELPDPYAGGMKISLPTIMRKGYELKKKSEASIPVSSPEDKEEKEADQVAEEVMTDLQPEKKKKKLPEDTPDQVMGKGTEGGTLDAETTAGVQNLQGKGSPLPDRTRVDMEQSFGADFSNVRVHTGTEAETLSRSMNARAFTYGSDIAFNKNEYSPDSQSGKRLLAHELTHTVQQGGEVHRYPKEEDKLPQETRKSSLGRTPTNEDIKRLHEFDLYISLLEVKKEEILQTQKGGSENKTKTSLRAIEDALKNLKYQAKTYRESMERAFPEEPIIGGMFPYGRGTYLGWLPEHEARERLNMYRNPYFRAGLNDSERLVVFEKQGDSEVSAWIKIALLKVPDFIGVTNAVEALKGEKIVTGEKLSTSEQVIKGVLAVISIASLAKVGKPRLTNWANNVGGGKFTLLRMAGASGEFSPVIVISEGGATMALTQTEIATLTSVGILNLAMMNGPGDQGSREPFGDDRTVDYKEEIDKNAPKDIFKDIKPSEAFPKLIDDMAEFERIRTISNSRGGKLSPISKALTSREYELRSKIKENIKKLISLLSERKNLTGREREIALQRLNWLAAWLRKR